MIGIADLHRTWGTDNYHTHALLQGTNVFTCYEAVEEQLAEYTKERYVQTPEQVIEDVFNIYRSINIVPINYYTEQGLYDAIRTLKNTSYNEVDNGVIGLGNNQGQGINRFCFPNMMTAEPKGRGSNSLKDRFNDDTKLRRAIRICFEFRTGDNLASLQHSDVRWNWLPEKISRILNHRMLVLLLSTYVLFYGAMFMITVLAMVAGY